ncbi:MAG: RNA 3'-terminal phosphate cyclase [Anaerolineae bacterium]
MIEIDGSLGEGGGQVLRTSLALSILTGRPLLITRIRAGRAKPGLQPQHLAAVRAAAQICAGQTEGAFINSQTLTFAPGSVRPGDYRFEIGTAGATSLVIQTIWLPLAFAAAASTVTVTGGTHVPWSPCYHYLEWQWVPFLRRIGLDGALQLELAGFYPQGGGIVRAQIAPAGAISPLRLTERGALKGIRGLSLVANLDMNIAERQRDRALRRLAGRHNRIEIELADVWANNKGTALILLAEFHHSAACYSALGAPGKRAEQVADEACLQLEKFLAGTGAVDEHLADQLLLPLAFADGPSEYRTARVTDHLTTNAAIIRLFGAAEIEIEQRNGGEGMVRIVPRPAARESGGRQPTG